MGLYPLDAIREDDGMPASKTNSTGLLYLLAPALACALDSLFPLGNTSLTIEAPQSVFYCFLIVQNQHFAGLYAF